MRCVPTGSPSSATLTWTPRNRSCNTHRANSHELRAREIPGDGEAITQHHEAGKDVDPIRQGAATRRRRLARRRLARRRLGALVPPVGLALVSDR